MWIECMFGNVRWSETKDGIKNRNRSNHKWSMKAMRINERSPRDEIEPARFTHSNGFDIGLCALDRSHVCQRQRVLFVIFASAFYTVCSFLHTIRNIHIKCERPKPKVDGVWNRQYTHGFWFYLFRSRSVSNTHTCVHDSHLHLSVLVFSNFCSFPSSNHMLFALLLSVSICSIVGQTSY